MCKKDKTIVLIDGSNLYSTIRLLGFDLDYVKLKKYLSSTYDLLRINYYTAVSEESEYSAIRPLVDFLDYNGYSITKKQVKEFVDQETGNRRIKGSLDVEIAVDIMKAAQTVDHIILVSGDGDFKYAVKAAQDMGVKVSVMSTIKSDGYILADDLRRQADELIDLADLKDKIARTDKPKESDKLPEGILK